MAGNFGGNCTQFLIKFHCIGQSTAKTQDVCTGTNVIKLFQVTFDYQHIDPGPDDPSFSRRRYLALNAMVEHERDTLLSHPLCQNLLYQKWVRFGRLTFYANLIIYVGYLCCLSAYIAVIGTTLGKGIMDTRDFCVLFLNESELNDSALVDEMRRNPPADRDLSIREDETMAMAGCLTVFIIIFLLKETFKIFQKGIKYFFDVFNLIALILCGMTYGFLHPVGYYPCLPQWRAGTIALFLAWINFIMYLRRIDCIGIYVIMLVTVLGSLLKVCLVWFFFAGAFAITFFIMINSGGFESLETAVLNIFVMTLGEIEFVDTFVGELGPFKPDVYILLIIFIILMPLVLMNLMIGIAVGDIEKIQRNAYLKRIALQVDLMYNFENTMPKWMQRKAYVRRVTIKPNEDHTYCWPRIKKLALGSKKNVHFIQDDHKYRIMGRIDNMEKEFQNHQNRVQENQRKQLALLNQISARMRINHAGVTRDTTSEMLNAAGQLSALDQLYDNLGWRS